MGGIKGILAMEADMSIEQTLAERGKRYGDFGPYSSIAQRIKAAMYLAPKWGGLYDDQKEALEMIALKIGRILNGDPNYPDHWHDIAGYAKLVEDALLTRDE